MKTQVQVVALLALVMIPIGVVGQFTKASDNGSNYAGWGNGDNYGYGFSAWSNTYGLNTGTFIGSPASDGMGTTGIGTSAFAMYATGSQYLNARRVFANAMNVGDVLTFYWAMNWDANGGAKGFDLKAGGTLVFNINNGGSATITSSDGIADANYGTNPMLVTLTRTSSSQYSFTMTRRSDGSTYSTTISSSLAVDRLEFYIGNQTDGSGNRNIYFNAITITSTSASTSIANSAGWRMMAAPASYTMAGLFSNVWLQGLTDITGFGSGNGTANIRYYTGFGYTNPTSAEDYLAAGRGFLYYHFNDDNYDGTPNGGPSTLSLTGAENASPVTFTPFHSSGTMYAIAGNPFATAIDWDLVGKGGSITSTAWVWNPGTGAYLSWNGMTGGLTDGLISPFQGFWIEYSSGSSTLTMENADKVTSATFRGKEAQPWVIALGASQGELVSTGYVQFSADGSHGKDRMDAVSFTPLATSFVHVGTIAEGVSYDINHLPMISEITEIPLSVRAAAGGIVALNVAKMNLPTGWNAYLRDSESGTMTPLNEDWATEITLPRAKMEAVNPIDILGQPVLLAAEALTRFSLVIDPGTSTAVDRGPETVDRIALHGAYPNPFNPSTQIRFTLDAPRATRLAVYDMLGRQVAILIDGQMPSGDHRATFDASRLTSGVYIVRLEAGGMSMTRRVTLLK